MPLMLQSAYWSVWFQVMARLRLFEAVRSPWGSNFRHKVPLSCPAPPFAVEWLRLGLWPCVASWKECEVVSGLQVKASLVNMLAGCTKGRDGVKGSWVVGYPFPLIIF